MNPFEFDVSVLFDLQKLVQDSEIAWVNKDLYRNKEGFVCVWKLVDGKNRIRLPFAICDYFGVKYNGYFGTKVQNATRFLEIA